MATAAMSLADRVQALPQELIDEIQELVFTPVPGRRNINSSHVLPPHTQAAKPVTLLHVNRATRRRFFSAYYSAPFIFQGFGTMKDWLQVQSDEHKRLIQRVTIVEGFLKNAECRRQYENWYQYYLLSAKGLMADYGEHIEVEVEPTADDDFVKGLPP